MRITSPTQLEALTKVRRRLPGEPDETGWQTQVVELGRVYGWDWLHARRSRGKGGAWTTALNQKGWPDLTLWCPPAGLVFAELKVSTGLRPDQATCLAGLLTMTIAAVYVWTPAEFDEVHDVFRRRGLPPDVLAD